VAKKLYVGNLPYSVDDETLQSHFSQYGNVESAKVIMDRESGRSKGFGFVEMAQDSDADSAIEKSNGTELNGRALNVSEARPQEPREGGRRPGGFGGGNRGGGEQRRGGFGGGDRGDRGGSRY
jgi:RNA recognition motif-containing protein